MDYNKLKPYIPLSETKYPKIYLDVPSFLGSRVVSNKRDLEGCDIAVIGVPWEG